MINIDIMGRLFPDPLTMLVQLAATGVLFLLFKKYLWIPVNNYLQKRADLSQQAIADAQLAKAEALEYRENAKRQLQEAAIQAQKIYDRFENEGKRVKETLLFDAQKQAQQKIEQAHIQIENLYKEMETEIRQEIVEVALLASEKLLNEKLDLNKDRANIDQFIQELGK